MTKSVTPLVRREPFGSLGGAFRGRGGGGAFLRLLLRLGLVRIVVDALLGDAGIGQPLVDAVRGNGALGDPGLGLFQVQLDAVGMVRGQQRVVETDLLDEAAVARAARVGDDDIVVRTLLGAAAGETNTQSHFSFPSLLLFWSLRLSPALPLNC